MAYNKLYVVVRTDQTKTQQAIQAGHAATEWARRHGDNFTHPTFVWLGVRNKLQLWLLCVRLVLANKPYVPFYEPSQNKGLTAIAIHHYHYGYSNNATRAVILRKYDLLNLENK